MSHEKCLKHVKTPCTSVAPSLVRVRTEFGLPHCWEGPRGGDRLVVRTAAGLGGSVPLCPAGSPKLSWASLPVSPSQSSSGASLPAGSHLFPPGSPALSLLLLGGPLHLCCIWVVPNVPQGNRPGGSGQCLGFLGSAAGAGLGKDQQGCRGRSGCLRSCRGRGSVGPGQSGGGYPCGAVPAQCAECSGGFGGTAAVSQVVNAPWDVEDWMGATIGGGGAGGGSRAEALYSRQVPVAHCFGPRGLYKRKFCAVCRKGLEAPALRCEVCELHVHPDCVPFACSDCRQCHQDGHRDHDTHHHHWREGNLPSSARCEVCRKACGSSDVLAGLRCEWCGIQAHSVCCAALAPECTFGRLRTMILPPACVRLLSRNFSKMHCFRISESEPGEGDESVDGSAPTAGTAKDVLASESSKQTLKIFDGSDAVQRNHFRVISVPRLARSEEVLEAALRAFYIMEDPRDFELQALPSSVQTGDTGGQRQARSGGTLEEEGSRGPGAREASPEAWTIRALPRPEEVLKIYPAWLKVGVAYVSLRVTPQSTARTVVLEVLPLLGRQAEGPESFQLVEVLMGGRQVQRTVLAEEELLLNRLRDIRKTSLRQMSQTRFYVAESRAVVPRVSLFVGGLPPGLSPQEYGNLLKEAVATKAGLVSLSHIYAAQGAVVLDVACFAEAERLYMLVRDTAVHGRPLTALVLPDVLHTKLPPDCHPLLVFVNPKSGGLKGRDLLCSFRKLLNPHQVFELTNGGPLPGFHVFSQVPCFRVLVCGGDGTVGWVLAALEEMRYRLACPEPSVAILPLGTGNDLGRVLRWGAGYSGEDPLSVLVSVDEADAVLMDRWTILLDGHEASSAENGLADMEPPKIVQMSNYCGIGIDAELSLDFHQAREEEPGKFTSRFHNKGVYVRVGLQKMNHSRSLHKDIRLQVEQQEVELPSIEGLIFINIPSWGSGADLWGSDSDSRFEKPRMDDGLLEVVGVTGVMHMGQVQGGLRSGIRIAQGSYFRVTLLKPTPVQVDGEPWVQAPGHMIISAASPKVHMLRKTKQKPKKAGTPKDTRADGVPAPEGDPK